MALATYLDSKVSQPNGDETYDTGSSTAAMGGVASIAYHVKNVNDALELKYDGDYQNQEYINSKAVDPNGDETYDTGSSTTAMGSVSSVAYLRKSVTTALDITESGTGPAASTTSSVTNNSVIGEPATDPPSFGDARLSSLGMEYAIEGGAGEARATLLGLEVAIEGGNEAARATVFGLEYSAEGVPGEARATVHGIEILMEDNRPELFSSVPRVAPTDGANGEPLVPMLEVFLNDGEVRRYSSVGMVAGEYHWAPGVTSFGSLNREIDPLSSDFRVQELQIEMDNSEGEWTALKASAGISGRTVRVLLGDPRSAYESFAPIFTGIIATNWTLTRTVFQFSATDVFSPGLGTPLLIPVTNFSFPFIPSGAPQGGMVPIVYGDFRDTDESSRLGRLIAWLIDPSFTNPSLGSVFRYVTCQGDIVEVTKVYVKGTEMTEGVDYEVVKETGSGLFFTADTVVYLDFVADPREATPADDDTEFYDVTWSGIGVENTDIPGTSFSNPAEILYQFMLKHTADFRGGDPFVIGTDRTELGLREEDFDLASVTQAGVAFNLLGIRGSFALTDINTKLSDVLSKFAQSFGLIVTSNRRGLIKFHVRSDEALSPGFVEHLVEGVHIVRDSLELTGMGAVISSATTKHEYDYADQVYEQTGYIYSGDVNSRNYGQHATLEFPYVRDAAVMNTVAAIHLYFTQEDRVLAFFQCDPHLHDDFDIGDEIALTAAAFPSEDGTGSQGRVMRVVSQGFDFSDPSSVGMTVRCVDVEAFGGSGAGSRYLTYAELFNTLDDTADPSRVEQPEFWSTLQ